MMSANEKQKPVVLVVEDDKNTQLLMSFLLRDEYDVCFAVSVAEAKQKMETKPVDLILLDLSLQGDEDGLDLVRYLRTFDRWKGVPVIATTAHAFARDRENCMGAGCNDYLSKPINRREMMDKIKKYIQK